MAKFKYSDAEQKLIENSRIPFGVFQYVDGKVVTIAITKGLSDLFGYKNLDEAYSVMNKDMYDSCHPDDVVRLADMVKRLSIDKEEVKTIYRRKAHGSYRVFRFHGVNIYKDNGVRLMNSWFADEGPYIEGDDTDSFTNSISRAVNERTQLHLFNHDYLTGLPSMAHFFELAQNGRDQMLNEGKKPCMLFLTSVE